MPRVPAVAVDWLTVFVNGFAAQPREVAGDDAVPPERATPDQSAVAAKVSEASKLKLAGQLWEVFAGAGAAERATALNVLLDEARLTPSLDTDGRLHWTTGRTDAAGVLAAACAVCLAEAVTAFGWHRLGTCDGCDCVDVYLDRAGRTPRRYCSATCLNRAKVRAYRSRQSSGR